MKHFIHISEIWASSYANLVMLQRLYKNLEEKSWHKARTQYLKLVVKTHGELKCHYCNRTNLKLISSKRHDQVTVDHIIPTSRGGSLTDFNNLVVCCNRCNNNKAALPVDEFMASKYIETKRACV